METTQKKIKISELDVIYKPGETNVTTFIKDGKSIYTGKTVDEYLKEGCILCSMDEACELIRPIEDRKYTGPFKEITEEQYNRSLEVLPPERWIKSHNAQFFRMSEYYTSNITSHFIQYKNRYFSANKRTSTTELQNLEEVQKLFFS
ncbi:DUF1419 domain-containing protein [Maribacter polysaccharolyticus]|uniref:DUF1419 domain-containing protein n=1 Tax=Maribacter polysaccharolyticus TaxID=3020831 RepID=UPI00237F4619|nr:DUF1419 domain-containing protein [Maribacter polysaccharolyticus]MDE3744001.1 DUF1419 domain-containing protein [Maribacter polysaccharolyticus]